jgi:poly-gamma-glutamate capsule biosynthesis protein CapA/YwtB (metallophosphatase superfamily)
MTVTLALAGDTMLGRKVGEQLTADPGAPLLAAELQDAVRATDLFILNLECSVSDRGAPVRDPDKRFFFRAPPVVAERLAGLGVSCVSLANNHALDFGTEALTDTLAHLEAAGIATVGAGLDLAAARAPVVLLGATGERVRVVAVADHPRSSAAAPGRPGIAFADLRGESIPDWLGAQATPGPDADLVVVAPHWGPNMRDAPVAHVRRAAQALEAAGATLIAGHSAHVPQGLSGRTLFDLGDFIDDYAVDPLLRNDLSLLWLVTLAATGPVRVEAVPVRLEFAYTRAANDIETTLLLSLLEERCAAVGSTVRREGGRLVFETA